MSLFRPSPERLEASARALNLRADELDREGKHGHANYERKKALRLEAKASAKRQPVSP